MVPNGWEDKPLLKLLDKIIDYRGQSVPKSDTGIPLITARNVRLGYLDFTKEEYVNEASFDSWMSRGTPKAGDILFTTEAPLGMACRYPKEGLYAVGQRTVTLRTNNLLDSEFLLYILLSEHGQRLIDIRSSGSTVKGIKSSELKKINIVYPSCTIEQRKIASILSTWDKAISTTERLIDNSKQQKKALIQQLLSGKKRLFDDSGKPFKGEWEKHPIGKLCKSIVPGRNKPKLFDGNIPWVTTPEFKGRFIPSKLQRNYITQSTLSDCGGKLVPKGAVVMAAVGELGLTAIATKSLVLNQQLHAFVCDKNINNVYLFYWLANQKPYMESVASKTTIMYMNKKNCESIPVLVPSIFEQQKIAAVLTTADKEIELLEQQLADLKQEKKALMQQLLTGKRRVKIESQE